MSKRPNSILGDAFAFEGRAGRTEFLLKLGFWQVIWPIGVFSLIGGLWQEAPSASPVLLLMAGNLVFLLPVATRRARDAGFPIWAFFACLALVVLAFVHEGRPWGYYACLLLLATAPTRKPKPLLLSREMRVFPT